MADQHFIFSLKWIERIKRVIEYVEMNLMGATSGRRRRSQAGGDGGGCDSQNTIWDITIFGTPTGGTFTLTVTVDGTAEVLTFTYNSVDSAAKTVLAGHSKIASTDLTVTAGPFPSSTMRVEFIATLANTLIALPTASFGSLNGGTGVGVIVAMAQRGHS